MFLASNCSDEILRGNDQSKIWWKNSNLCGRPNNRWFEFMFDFHFTSHKTKEFFTFTSSISDSCQGDSGGPFMQIANSEFGPRYYITGIVSLGPEQCGSGLGVYTKITAHMPAILDTLR